MPRECGTGRRVCCGRVRDDTDQDELLTYQPPPIVATSPFPRVHTKAETKRFRVQAVGASAARSY